MLAQTIKVRSGLGAYAASETVCIPLKAYLFETNKNEDRSDLHIYKCKKVLPLSLLIESALCSIDHLISCCSKFGAQSWEILCSAGEIAIETARLVHSAEKDMDYMCASPASFISISDALICLRRYHMIIVRRLQKTESAASRKMLTDNKPSLALKTRLHECANQIQFIVNSIKPCLRRKADEPSNDSKEKTASAANDFVQEEDNDGDDLEPSSGEEDRHVGEARSHSDSDSDSDMEEATGNEEAEEVEEEESESEEEEESEDDFTLAQSYRG
jgi:hypothetical protein